MSGFMKSFFVKHGTKKADVSRILFWLSWVLGAGVVIFDIAIADAITQLGVLIPTVSDSTYNFLIFFISTFTANYLGRRATDAWRNTKVNASVEVIQPQTTTQAQPTINVIEAKRTSSEVIHPGMEISPQAGLGGLSNIHNMTNHAQ